MSKVFSCYIHTAGTLTPHFRLFACDDERRLLEKILSMVTNWAGVEQIDVYDETDRAVFSLPVQGSKAN